MNSESVANISIPLIKVFIIERTNLLAILLKLVLLISFTSMGSCIIYGLFKKVDKLL